MDLVMVEKSIQASWYIPLVIIVFTCVQGGLGYVSSYLNTWAGAKITNGLKFDLYKKMLRHETGFYNTKKSGDVIFMFNNNADMACAGLLKNLKTFVQRLFSSLSLIAVMFYNSWQLALICVAVLVFAFLPATRVKKRINSVIKKSITADSAILTSYNESYAGNKTIISYNLEECQADKFSKVLDNIFMLRIKMIQRTSWLSPLMHMIMSIGIGLAIWYGSYLILSGQISSGSFVSFLTAMIMLYTPLKSIGGNFNSMVMSFMAIDRVFNILNAEPKIKDRPNARHFDGDINTIEFKNLTFEYVPGRPVLKDINLTVRRGETVALVGNSGGGKTTLVSLLPRFYDPTGGVIMFNGTDIRDFTLKSLRQNIAVVFQDNFLFAGTIRENIMLGNDKAGEEDLQKAIKMAYLDDFVSTLPNGLDTEIGERGILLSGGQKQRVAIARAFLKNAPILVLDEATSALDNKAEAIVQKAIENLMADKTVFVIAHRLSTIRNADKIAVINDGHIVEQGTHDELISREGGAYKALHDMQFRG